MADLFDLADILGSATPSLRVAAVGAMFMGEGEEPHERLMRAGRCEVIGFEPQQDECARLNQMHGPRHRYLPYVIGDGSRRTFHRTAAPMTSSLYPPDLALARKFQGLAELLEVVETREVTTVRLDDVAELGDVDFLKLDVQGAELDVVRGGKRTLAGAVAIQAEIGFVPLYRGQPLFADLDIALRETGFIFHRFVGPIHGRAFRPLQAPRDPYAMLSQVLWTDCVYVRDFMRLDSLPPRKLLALALILHEAYRSADLCALALHAHDKLTGSDFWAPYIARLVGTPPARRLED